MYLFIFFRDDFIASTMISVDTLRQGWRSIPLKDWANELCSGSLFVHVEINSLDL